MPRSAQWARDKNIGVAACDPGARGFRSSIAKNVREVFPLRTVVIFLDGRLCVVSHRATGRRVYTRITANFPDK